MENSALGMFRLGNVRESGYFKQTPRHVAVQFTIFKYYKIFSMQKLFRFVINWEIDECFSAIDDRQPWKILLIDIKVYKDIYKLLHRNKIFRII